MLAAQSANRPPIEVTVTSVVMTLTNCIRCCFFALLLLASAACRPTPTLAPEVDASVLEAEQLPSPPLGPSRYRVENLPTGHGYRVGQLLALYGTVENLAELQPIGVAEVFASFDHAFELASRWIDPAHEKQAIVEVRPLPRGHQFGGIVGQVLEQPDPQRVHLNMGMQQGLSVGSMYEVLGDDTASRTIGLVQVVGFDGQLAVADVVVGEAPEHAFVIWAGRETTRPQPLTRVLVARFARDRGDGFSQSLRTALDQIAARALRPDIVVESSATIVTGDEQAIQIGRDAGANVVVWGSASAVGSNLEVRPQVTLIDAQSDGPIWEPVDVARARVFPDRQSEVSRRVHGLASYVIGLIYYTGFDHDMDRSFVRASLHFESAIEHGDAVDARNARVWLFYSLEVSGDQVRIESLVRAAERDADARADEAWQTMVLFMQARRTAAMQQFDEAFAHAEEAARRLTAAGNVEGRVTAMEEIANIHEQRGDLDEALRIRVEQLPAYENGDIGVRALALGRIADLHFARGELDEALRIHVEEQLPAFDETGNVWARALTMSRVADIHEARGEHDEALRIRRDEQLPVFEQLENHLEIAATLGQIANIYKARGEFDEALRIRKDEQLPVIDKLGDIRARTRAMVAIATLHLKRHELDEGLRILEAQLPVYEQFGDKRNLMFGHALIGSVLLRRNQPGDRQTAATYLLLAIAAATELGMTEEAEEFAGIIRRAGL